MNINEKQPIVHAPYILSQSYIMFAIIMITIYVLHVKSFQITIIVGCY